MTRAAVVSVLLTAVSCVAAARVASAQDVPYMRALSTPPATVGTCLPLGDDAARGPRATPSPRASHLVIKTREPGGDRDMTAFVDDAGVVLSYNELAIRQTGIASSASEMLTSRRTEDGAMEGAISYRTIVMPAPDFRPGVSLDSAMRERQARAKSTSRREALTADEQRRVRALASWLVKRCPVTEGRERPAARHSHTPRGTTT